MTRLVLINGVPGAGKTTRLITDFDLLIRQKQSVIIASKTLAPIEEIAKRRNIKAKSFLLRTFEGFATSACYHYDVIDRKQILNLKKYNVYKYLYNLAKKYNLSTKGLSEYLNLGYFEDLETISSNNIVTYLNIASRIVNEHPYDFKKIVESSEKLIEILEFYQLEHSSNFVSTFQDFFNSFITIPYEKEDVFHYIHPKLLALKHKIDIFKIFKKEEKLIVDYLLVDEAQNISNLDIALINLSEKKEIRFYGDFLQNLLRFAGMSYLSLKKLNFDSKIYLNKTHRFGYGIAKFVNKFLRFKPAEIDINVQILSEKTDGVFKFITKNKFVELCRKLVLNNEQVVILCRRRLDVERITKLLRNLRFYVLNDFEEEKIFDEIAEVILNNDISKLKDIRNKFAEEVYEKINRKFVQKRLDNFLNNVSRNESGNVFEKIIEEEYKNTNLKKYKKLLEIIRMKRKAFHKLPVFVTTIHKFQGKEADNVILYYLKSRMSDYIEEYASVYVGITRAKKLMVYVYDGENKYNKLFFEKLFVV